MASDKEYVEYVCERIMGIGAIRYRKMFGEYMIYVNEKPLLLVCDNTVYIKKLDCIEKDMSEAESAPPYTGAKEHYILDVDDAELSARVVAKAEAATPVPVKKKKV